MTQFEIENLVSSCKNLQETARHYDKQKTMLAEALAVFVLVPKTRAWLELNDPMSLRHATLALGALAVGDSKIDLNAEEFPWCIACQSYHAPNNPTCFRLKGRQANPRS